MLYGLEAITNAKTIYVFGASENGRKCADRIRYMFPDVIVGYLDNSNNTSEVDVIKPDMIDCSDTNTWVVIYSDVHHEEMYRQLRSVGFCDDRIVFTTSILEKRIQQLEKIIEKRIPPREIDVVFDVVEHCNLNCQSCDHFSSIASPMFADLQEFELDLRKLVRILGDDGTIRKFFIAGGEPLLHKEIEGFIEVSRSILNNSQICIFTNGILLEQMDSNFWNKCQKCKTQFFVTRYPIDIDYCKIKNMIISYGLKCIFEPENTVRTSMHKPLDLNGKQDIYRSFHKCYMGAGICTALKHGKLYTCTMIPSLHIFNNYFNENLEISESDYVDLGGDVTKADIMAYLSNPVPACRFCKVDEWTYDNPWKTTGKAISEWI